MAKQERYTVSEYVGRNHWKMRLNKVYPVSNVIPSPVWGLIGTMAREEGQPKLTRVERYPDGDLPSGGNVGHADYYYGSGEIVGKNKIPEIMRDIDMKGKTIDAFAPFTPAARLSIAARSVVKSRRYSQGMAEGQTVWAKSTRAAAMKYTWKDEYQMHRQNLLDFIGFIEKSISNRTIEKGGLRSSTALKASNALKAALSAVDPLSYMDDSKS